LQMLKERLLEMKFVRIQPDGRGVFKNNNYKIITSTTEKDGIIVMKIFTIINTLDSWGNRAKTRKQALCADANDKVEKQRPKMTSQSKSVRWPRKPSHWERKQLREKGARRRRREKEERYG